MSHRPIITALLAAHLVVGCRAAAPGASVSPASAAYTGPMGAVALSVSIAGTRSVQWVESYRATSFTAEVTGAGISGWIPLTPVDNTTGEFGAMGPDGLRLASMSARVPAGDRRVFRVKVYDTAPEPDVVLQEIWGVGDVPANTGLLNTYPVTVKPMTTPTGRIFYRLLQLDEPKAMTLPIDNVQHFVEELLNTNGITNDPLRPGVAQVDPSVLDVDKATAAIVRGNSGVPFQIPAPIPDALLVRDPVDPLKRSLPDAMRRRGQVHARVLDVFGRVVSRPFVYYLTDLASRTRHADATTPAEVTFDEVTPGDWQLVATDLDRGPSTRKAVSVPADALTDAFVVSAPDTAIALGTYDAEADAADSFNGENVPATLAYMSDPGGFVAEGGRLTWVDAGSERVRRADADEPRVVHTIAGTGIASHKGDGGPALEAWLTLSSDQDVAVDKNGVTYVSQTDGSIRAIGADGVIRNFWAPSGSSYSGLGKLAYDADRHGLLVSCQGSGNIFRLKLAVFDGSNPALLYNSAAPGQNGIEKLAMTAGGTFGRADICVSGDWAIATNYNTIGGGYGVYRQNLVTNQVDRLVGAAPVAAAGDDTPAADLAEGGLRAPSLDAWGNLFFRGDLGLYRLTGATGPAAATRVKLVVPDANIMSTSFDETTQTLFYSTRKAFTNAGGTTRMVPVVQRLVP